MPWTDEDGKVWTSPGDEGPCDRCREWMHEGRYNHMRLRHGIFEHYKMPNTDNLIVLGQCQHGVDLDHEFCPEGCKV